MCRSLRKKINDSVEDRANFENAWEEYKKKQKTVKYLIRKARGRTERDIVNELRAKGVEGGREWYSFLRGDQAATKEKTNVNELKVGERVIRDKHEMTQAVQEFWKDIGGGNDRENRDDPNLVIERMIYENMDGEISKAEIEKYLKKLKLGKASGMDGIPYEFYKMGGRGVVEGLHKLFNRILEEERVPSKWNESRVSLLHKGGHKSKRELKNYRPISLSDTVCKVFCGIMNERLKEIFERNNVMGEEQNGFRSDRRGEDNLFVVREVIEKLRKRGKKGYIAFLDIEKAYDRVNRYKMCKILERVGVSDKFTSIIKSLYEHTRAKYSLGDIETDCVESNRGVRQGCPASSSLFGLYTEELAVRVRSTGIGVNIGGRILNILLYADDVVILSESKDDLQKLLDVVSEFGRDFNVNFSKEKSQVLIINGGEDDADLTWTLRGSTIGITIGTTHEYEYLGMLVDEKGCENTKQDRISRANQWVGRLSSVARTRANKYEVVRGVWKGMAVPSLMYGLETMRWTKNDLDKLEVVQNKVGRIALGANRYVAVEAIRGEVGWSTFAERITKAALRYKVRLEKMDGNRWAKWVYEWSKHDSKWNGMCENKTGKYVMHGVMTLANWAAWSMDRWKKVINEHVQEGGKNEWKENMRGKDTLDWYMAKASPKKELFYDGSMASELLFKARTKSLELNSRTYKWNDEGSKVCNKCDRGVDETIEHVMLECEKYEREREEMLNVVKLELGPTLWDNMCQLAEGNPQYLVVYLLGLSLTDNWNEVTIEGVKSFLESMWLKRVQP